MTSSDASTEKAGAELPKFRQRQAIAEHRAPANSRNEKNNYELHRTHSVSHRGFFASRRILPTARTRQARSAFRTFAGLVLQGRRARRNQTGRDSSARSATWRSPDRLRFGDGLHSPLDGQRSNHQSATNGIADRQHEPNYAGLCQSSTVRRGTRVNSRTLFVTRTAPRASAWPAKSTSCGPMGWALGLSVSK